MRISECGRTLLFEVLWTEVSSTGSCPGAGPETAKIEINAIQVLNHNPNCLHELRDGPMMKA